MRDPIAPFMTRQLLNVTVETAAADAAAMRATSDARDLDAVAATRPLPIYTYDEWQGRLAHEPGHCMAALEGHATEIEALLRPDGSGWCSYTPIENPLDAITTHLAGFAAEVRVYPPGMRRYVSGCHDFIAARLLIDQYNAAGRWPPLTCEAAASAAVAFVDSRWAQIRALTLALESAGNLTDFEVRLFAGCAR